jgi:hypothetical protein
LHVDENPHKAWSAAAVIDGDAKGEAFGWAVLPEVSQPHQLILELSQPVRLEPGDTLVVELRQNHGKGSHTLGHFRLAGTSSYDIARRPLAVPLPGELVNLVGNPEREAAQTEQLFAYFKKVTPELAELRRRLVESRKAKDEFEATLPRCLVSVSTPELRTVRILPRGNFLIESGDIVEPALPAYLTESSKSPGRRLTRLDLAEWIVSRDNPLTARVFVNRLWKQFFGMGLSKVLDDLGSQGEPPPNQELLDWLACEFMDSGWDVKHLVRLIVNSDTYKQASNPSRELQTRDPYNRELASQSRWRLEAELVRDNALSISGLLATRIGGPSVKPYQPDGYWENLNFPPRTYEASKGEDQYRRGLYTWWQRSFLHPSMVAFDAPSREECVAERNRSNIPQQALVLLNDPTYVEAARVFAGRILKEGGTEAETRLRWAWREALSRSPTSEELRSLEALLEKHLKEYRANETEAQQILSVGFLPSPTGLEPAEVAAWTSVARAILNLYETVTRS